MNYLLTWTAIPTATSYDINSRYMDGSFVLLGTASTNSLTVSVSSFTAFQILAKDISANVINIQYAYYPTFQYFINGQDVVDLVRSEVDDGDLQGGYTFSNELMQNFIDQAAIKYARYIPNMVTVAELTQTAILDSSTIEVFDVYTPDSKGMKTNNYEE